MPEKCQPEGCTPAKTNCSTVTTTNTNRSSFNIGPHAPEKVEQILRRSAFDEDGDASAGDRHADLVDALGRSTFAVCAGYKSISEGELPEGLEEDGLLEA